jgi:hypothetical protein
MSFRINISGIGNVDMSKEESNAWGNLLTTKSTDSGSAEKSANVLGGIAYAESLVVLPTDATVEVYETPEVKNATEKIRARYTLSAVIKRITAAATQDERQGEIFAYDDKEEKTTEVKTTVPVGGWLAKVAK